MPSGWRNLPLSALSASNIEFNLLGAGSLRLSHTLMNRRLHSASELRNVLDDNWPVGEVQTRVEVLDMEYQIDNEHCSLNWEQEIGDTALLSYLSYVRLDTLSSAVSWAICSD